MRIFATAYAIVTGIIAIYSTFAQVQPALFIIDLLTFQGKFPATIVLLLTWLLLLIPLLVIGTVFNVIHTRRNKKVIENLSPGVSGIIIHRRPHLISYVVNWNLLANGQKKGAVGAGAHVYIPIEPGTYEFVVSGVNRKSAPLTVEVPVGRVLRLETGIDQEKIIREGRKAAKDSIYLVVHD